MRHRCADLLPALDPSSAQGLRPHLLCLVLMTLASASLQAQSLDQADPSGRQGFRFTPSLNISQTWTDNNTLSSTAADAALITMVTPGINIVSNTGRLKGSLDYSLSGVLYTKSEEKNRTQQALTARGVAELIENLFYVDGNASISQQVASAFAQQTSASNLSNPNRTEVATANLSPYVRGRLGSFANFELRGNAAESNTKDSIVGDSSSLSASLRLDSEGMAKLGWWASASSLKSHYRAGADSKLSSASFGLKYRPDVDLLLGINGGLERSDYLTGQLQNSKNYGLNATWTPSPITNLALDWQHHAYGDSHLISFDHRWPRSSLRISDSQTASTGGGTNPAGQNTNYDLLSAQYSSIEPDPIKRDALVREILRSRGLSPDAIATASFLTGGPTLSRSQIISFTTQGVRSSLTGSISQTSTKRLGNSTPSSGDLSLTSNVVQRSYSLTTTHQLTPISGLSLTLTQSDGMSDQAGLASTLRSATANWTWRLGPRLSGQLGARHSRFSSVSFPYRESAVFANILQQF
ncbi:TIGR03016 family PEP-CTERM system-associated outer membrane protein [Paucibacter sp. KBW04]|uniref:TIGR03016 family PEP-CTERM system-associated outer membrane protein n=1 Tax=Paucibacter sp. KBW04 TaxID=2153361 RepID=UPI0018CC5FF7|nr:TIGR03016 family PEP-CTERM system-associated outer membrane protein [Paucibacter sp. KBW04]